tara:strand:+ start:44895 stop:45542 length:648 start_codon:yes stop_codon:yes gene_type:complete
LSLVREEDYLILLIDSFFDFKDGVLMLGYDLRIDAYTYFELTPPLKKISLIPGKIYQVKRKITKIPGSADDHIAEDIQIEQKIKAVDESKLNPIEKIYYANYQHHKKKSSDPTPNAHVVLCVGEVKQVENRVSVLGPCTDLTVKTDETPDNMIIRVQTNTYEVGDAICFLLRKISSSQGWSYRVLGYKNKQQTADYLNPDFRSLRNLEINPIDFR